VSEKAIPRTSFFWKVIEYPFHKLASLPSLHSFGAVVQMKNPVIPHGVFANSSISGNTAFPRPP
jgi:hypothetical protein